MSFLPYHRYSNQGTRVGSYNEATCRSMCLQSELCVGFTFTPNDPVDCHHYLVSAQAFLTSYFQDLVVGQVTEFKISAFTPSPPGDPVVETVIVEKNHTDLVIIGAIILAVLLFK